MPRRIGWVKRGKKTKLRAKIVAARSFLSRLLTNMVEIFAGSPGGGTGAVSRTIGEQFLQTITVENTDGASGLTTPYVSFGLPVPKGAVNTASQTIEVRKSDGVTVATAQIDNESTSHSDGSLNFCTVAFQADNFSAAGTNDYKIYAVTGSKDTSFRSGESEATSRSTVTTDTDFKIELSGGDLTGTWTASLNDCLASGELLRSGPLCRRWKCWEKFNDGTSDHGDLWARFYVTLWEDGTTISVFAQVINGYVADGALYNYDLVFKDGATTLLSGGNWSAIAHHHHSIINVVDTDGLQHWDSNEPTVFVAHSRNYLANTKAVWMFKDVTADTPAAGAVDSYTPLGSGSLNKAFGTTGERADIGHLTAWSVRALMTQDKDYFAHDRAQALSIMSAPIFWIETNGKPPVMVTASYVSDGMAASRPTAQAQDYTNSGGDGGWSGLTDSWSSHAPEAMYYQALCGGDEWFIDANIAYANYYPLITTSGTVTTIAGKDYERIQMQAGQHRSSAWAVRTLDNAWWICPDNFAEKNYLQDLVYNNYEFAQKIMTTPEASGGIQDEMQTLKIFYWKGRGGLGNLYLSVWQVDMFAVSACMGARRDIPLARSFVSDVLDTFVFGRGVDGCMFNSFAYHTSWRADDDTVYESWASFKGDGTNNPNTAGTLLVPVGGCPASGVNEGGSGFAAMNSPTKYQVIGLGAGEAAEQVNIDAGTTVIANATTWADYMRAVETDSYDRAILSDSEYATNSSYVKYRIEKLP